ncbi:MAG: hypothetical protein HYV07_21525 [Deltaproteobacteria bacterium]|nr:hypothetical protein [Deltaproteobacteria bacterium]
MSSPIKWTLVDGSIVAELGDYRLEILPKQHEIGPPEDFGRWWEWDVAGDDGDSVAEGVSWRSEDEAKACAEAVARVLSIEA